LVGKPKEKKSLGRSSRIWEDKIKMYLIENKVEGAVGLMLLGVGNR
jgi:hypothetical protein